MKNYHMKKQPVVLQRPASPNPIKTALLALTLASGLTASAQTTTTSTNFSVGATVPDYDLSGLASAKAVSTPIAYLTGVKVNVKLSGTFNGAMYCYLAHNGTNAILLNRVGRSPTSSLGYSDKGFDLTFDDAAVNGDVHVYRTKLGGPISGPLTNSWAPDARRTSPTNVLTADARTAFLSGFNGMNPNGEWVLFVADMEAGDIYTLNNWGLEITGYTPPTIVSAPAIASAECASASATFSVSAAGSTPLAYQWRFNANPIAGATGSSFTINNATFANAGNYDAVVTNNYGAITSAVATLTVQDTTPPVANAASLSAVIAQCSATLPPAPTASDACEGLIIGTPDQSGPFGQGDTTITWTFTDSHGNSSIQQQAVHIHDTTIPVVTLLGSSTVTVQCHGGYTDAGGTASDNCDGNITSRIVTVNPVDANTLGTYTVTYNVSDTVGNAAVQVTRTVIVQDTLAPVPNVASLPDVTGQCSATVTAPTATDACAGVITATTSDPLTYTAQGNYVVLWTYNDGNGNSVTQTQNVKVHDTMIPVITLVGGSTVTVQCHSGYTDAGATASDNCDGNITSRIVTVNPVDANTLGTYTVTYNVSDTVGNPAVQVTRTVIVQDTLAPVPNVASLPDVTGQCSATVTAPTATDACAGVITATTSDPLTYTAQGDYVVLWTYSDGNGNSITQTQSVKVHDTTIPVITLLGSSTVTVQCHGGYTDAGATASDNCDGNITSRVTTVNPVDANTLGTYTVTYNVSDTVGNAAVQVTRTVIVQDTLAPVPNVASLPDVTGQCSATVTAPTATDACAGIITATTSDPLTYTAQGDYVVH